MYTCKERATNSLVSTIEQQQLLVVHYNTLVQVTNGHLPIFTANNLSFKYFTVKNFQKILVSLTYLNIYKKGKHC